MAFQRFYLFFSGIFFRLLSLHKTFEIEMEVEPDEEDGEDE